MKVLIVEDSRRLRESLVDGLRRLGFAVDAADNGEDGLRLARTHDYDVVVLDLMLPGLDGMTVLDRLRVGGSTVHVLILTARDAVPDRVAGLQRGADDYLSKPFAFDELVARIQALSRRKYGQKLTQIIIGDLHIDLSARRVRRGGADIVLTSREYMLLEYLALRQGQIVNRQQIEEAIYDGRVEPSSNAVDSAICVLRRKIDPEKSPQSIIQTRRGLGYVLAGTDSTEASSSA